MSLPGLSRIVNSFGGGGRFRWKPRGKRAVDCKAVDQSFNIEAVGKVFSGEVLFPDELTTVNLLN